MTLINVIGSVDVTVVVNAFCYSWHCCVRVVDVAVVFVLVVALVFGLFE